MKPGFLQIEYIDQRNTLMGKHILLIESFFKPEVSLIEESDIPQLVDILYEVFGQIDSKEEIERKLRPRMLNGVSIKLGNAQQIIGCYILNPRSVNAFIEDINQNKLKDFNSQNTKFYIDKKFSDKGLQGIALAILPDWRSYGFGNLLKTWYDSDPRFDYIWGVQDKRLGNIDHWKKSREIIAECPTHFATLRELR